jgi:hypothetical protein
MHENIPVVLQAPINEPNGVRIDGVFDVPPMTDECLRYVLHVEDAPNGTVVTVNSWYVGSIHEGELIADVTDNITLQGNVLMLTIALPGSIGAVYLQPTPCADA